MPSVVIDVQQAEDSRDVIHRAVAALAEGKILAIPTETVYGLAASALNADAVQRLVDIKGRDANKPLALAIKSADDALDYVPTMSVLARRLARRCWPGPVTLVLDDAHPDSVVGRLPERVRELVVPNGTVGLRVPANETTLQILRLLAGPLVLTSANKSGGEEAIDAKEILEVLDGDVDLVIDDGRCRFGQASSVVQVQGNELKMLREGVVQKSVIDQLTGFMALIVCTGNTCRSPMGEALLKQAIAEKLSIPVEDLGKHGIAVASAGIAAMPGGHASRESIDVMEEAFGIDLNTHSSQPVTDRLARHADIILTMTEGHRYALVSHWPDVAPRTHLLRKDGHDVTDPIGYSATVYKNCAEQIQANLKEWVDELALPEINPKQD